MPVSKKGSGHTWKEEKGQTILKKKLKGENMKIDGIQDRELTVYVAEAHLYLTYRMFVEWSYAEKRHVYDLVICLDGETDAQSCYYHDVAVSYAMAQRIWDLFTTGLVTPVTAGDILEELLSDANFLYKQDA